MAIIDIPALPFHPDRLVQQGFRAIIRLAEQLSGIAILDGRLITGVRFSPSGTIVNIPHGLNRAYRGWVPVGVPTTAATTWMALRADTNVAGYPIETHFRVYSDNVGTYAFWVF